MTLYLIATALTFLALGFSLAQRRYIAINDDIAASRDELQARHRVQSDAFNHILKQRNDLQNKLNELTK